MNDLKERWKKTCKKIVQSFRNYTFNDDKIESLYKNSPGVERIKLYQPNTIIHKEYFGKFSSDYKKIEIFCAREDQFHYSDILVDEKNQKYYIEHFEPIRITISVKKRKNLNIYSHFGYSITLDSNVIEIQALHIDNSYYLYKKEKDDN